MSHELSRDLTRPLNRSNPSVNSRSDGVRPCSGHCGSVPTPVHRRRRKNVERSRVGGDDDAPPIVHPNVDVLTELPRDLCESTRPDDRRTDCHVVDEQPTERDLTTDAMRSQR
jgi:hypothetical protein